LFALLKLINDRELMGSNVNGPIYNVAAYLTVIVVTALSVLYILVSIFPNIFKF
jgi:Mn2+/Fe2+ NRAMP family transporter